MAVAKHYVKAVAAREEGKTYSLEEAIGLAKRVAWAKFDESVDLAVRLGVNPKHADQMVRGAVLLPHGTGKEEGLILPVVVTIYQDRSFTFEVKTPPAAVLLKRAAGIAKASANPLQNKIGKVSRAQVREIAQTKLPDLNTDNLEAAMRVVEGTARSMGLEVVG